MDTVDEKQANETIEAVLQHLADGGTLKDCLKATDDEMEAIYVIAYRLMNSGKLDKAISLLRFLALHDHLEQRWHYALGVALQKKGEYQAAVRSYAVATLLDCYDPLPQAQAGYCLVAMGQYVEAREALEGARMVAEGGAPGLLAQIDSLLATVRKNLEKEGKKEGGA